MITLMLAAIPSAVALILVAVLFGAAIVRAVRGEFRETELRWTPDLEGLLPDPAVIRQHHAHGVTGNAPRRAA